MLLVELMHSIALQFSMPGSVVPVFHKHIKMKKLYSSDANMMCNILRKANHFNFSFMKNNEF